MGKLQRNQEREKIMILTSKHLQEKQIDVDLPEAVELLAAEIKTKDINIFIANIYIPPQTLRQEHIETRLKIQ